MYSESCCYEDCQLCRTQDNRLLDMRTHVVKQGGYEASCGGISNILTASPKEDSVCTDSQAQFQSECCYQKCSLCRTNVSTEWYATVLFEGLTTTCLGLDFMLRTQQISHDSERCSELQETYTEACCQTQKNSCQLCEAGDKMYQIYPSKTVTTEDSQSTLTTCTALNNSLSKLEMSHKECVEGKQTYFQQCCDLSNLISLVDGGNGSVGDDGGVGASEEGSSLRQPSPGGESPEPPDGQLPTTPDSTFRQPKPAESTANSASSSSPTSQGQTETTSNGWPEQSETNNGWQGSGFSWERDWQPPNGGSRDAVGTRLVVLGVLGLSCYFSECLTLT